jgi:xylulose-5-phosphate/fructose-6-phosphate phosphoketolase
MRLQDETEHPHGMSSPEFDELFTKDKPIIFAFHGYPWLIHRLTYRRTNPKLHVRGYKEEGTITTAFDMTVRNDMDRFHLVKDVIYRAGLDSTEAKQLDHLMDEKLLDHSRYIVENGMDMPEVLNWTWQE